MLGEENVGIFGISSLPRIQMLRPPQPMGIGDMILCMDPLADREDHGCREENALAEHAAQQGDGRNAEDPY